MRSRGGADRSALLVTVLLSTYIGCTTAPRTPPQPAKIVFEHITHDFGRAAQGATVQHQFPFRNAGGLALTIATVRASCGCQATLAAAAELAAGEGGTIQVACDTAHVLGHTVRTITVDSNDPVNSVTVLTLRGEIDADASAEPARLYLGHVRAGQTMPTEVRVVTPHDGAVVVEAIEADGPVIAAAATDPSRRRIRLAVRKDAPAGRFSERLFVRSSGGRQPLITIAIAGTVDGAALPTRAMEEHRR